MIQSSDRGKRTAIVLFIYDLRRNICLKVLTFLVIGEKLIFGFRNHAKIWVSGKLGYEVPSNFKIGVNCAEWSCLYTTYEATCTLKRLLFELST